MKILGCITLLAVTCIMSTSVFAEGFFVNYSSQNPDIIEIGGEGEGNTKITISVFQKGENFGTLDGAFDEKTEQLRFISTAITGTDGTWKIEWIPSEGGEFDFYASAGEGKTPELISRRIVSGMKTVYETLRNGEEAALAALFEQQEYMESLVTDKEILSEIKQPGTCGRCLYRLRREFPEVDAPDLIPLAASLTALDESKSAYALEVTIQEYQALGITLKNIEVYKDNATDDITKNLAQRFAGCSGMSKETFSETFSEQLILAGIAECVNWKDAELYLDLIDNPDYEKNKEIVAKAVAGKNYTMSELIIAIKNAISITSSSNSGGSGSGSNKGSSGTSSISVTVPNIISDKPSEVRKDVIFNDVDSTHWAFDYINFLRWKNIVCGDEEGNFYPENSITRAEIVKMLCEAFEIAPDMMYNGDFSDVTSEDWFVSYINAGWKSGLISGTGDGFFSPRANVSREDLAVLIYRFAKKAGHLFNSENVIDFADIDETSDYAEEAMEALCAAGVLSGIDGRLMPKAEATRAQTAVMIYKVLEAKKVVTE